MGSNAIMVSKVITLLSQISIFNKDIREWRQQTTNLKIWYAFNTFFHRACCEKRRAVTNAGKGGYTAAEYDVLPR